MLLMVRWSSGMLTFQKKVDKSLQWKRRLKLFFYLQFLKCLMSPLISKDQEVFLESLFLGPTNRSISKTSNTLTDKKLKNWVKTQKNLLKHMISFLELPLQESFNGEAVFVAFCLIQLNYRTLKSRMITWFI